MRRVYVSFAIQHAADVAREAEHVWREDQAKAYQLLRSLVTTLVTFDEYDDAIRCRKCESWSLVNPASRLCWGCAIELEELYSNEVI